MYWLTKIWPLSRLGKNVYFHGKRADKKIALTFDDGPSNKTRSILRLLKKRGARATFFVLGSKISKNKDKILAIRSQGSEIGNHAYNHKSLIFKPKKYIFNQIIKTDKELANLGIKSSIIRPPHGSFGYNAYKIASSLNKKVILWDVDPRDWSKPGKEKVIEYIINNVKNGSIIDLHEYSEGIGKNDEIIPIIEELIPLLQKRGYSLVTISELLEL